MKQAYLIGGGIASLASAAYLIRDGGLSGSQIRILEETGVLGGSLDGAAHNDKVYVIRGGRMMNFTYGCTYDLFSDIPSLVDPTRTVLAEIQEFNARVKTSARARLVKNGQILDVSHMGFSNKDRLALTRLMLRSERSLGYRSIQDCFEAGFFSSNFWFMWASMFAFEPWHSAVEFKRYLHRFVHEFPRIQTLAGVDRTPYNQYDSMIRPLEVWLQKEGVQFMLGAEVKQLQISETHQKKTVSRLDYVQHGRESTIAIQPEDLVFVTNGSMTAASTLGSMDTPAPTARAEQGGSWALWRKLAHKYPEFGHPEVFSERIEQSKWLSFTLTSQNSQFFDLMEKFSGNKEGTGALVTFVDSPWLMSVVLAHQPHFIGQPDHVKVCWGYGLYPDRPGRFVKKPMSACTGAEMLEEMLGYLPFSEALPEIRANSVCIPCSMPYITSQFLTRSTGDRPAVIPEGSTNLAFIGQFCEIPNDVVFTVEYSVRSAQIAVYDLLKLDKQPVPMYRGERDVKVLWQALKTLLS